MIAKHKATFQRLNDHAQLLILLGSSAAWVHRIWKERQTNSRVIVLRFSEEDRSLYYLLRWMEKLPPASNLRVFDIAGEIVGNGTNNTATLKARPGRGVEFVFHGVKGHIEAVPLETSQPQQLVTAGSTSRPSLQVRFETKDPAIRTAFLADVLHASEETKTSHVYAYGSWNGWARIRDIKNNRAAILPDTQLQDLTADAEHFSVSEDWYQRVGLPYRRRYLFHGVPGSGKTSTTLALASVLDMHVCVLNLQGLNDEKLANAVREAPSRSLILLEDIDCAMTAGTRDSASSLTLSGLLNVIDGATTPDGSVMVLTTNHRCHLDPALIRPGRVDYELEFKNATADQIMTLADRFNPAWRNDVLRWAGWADEGITMATAQERLIQRHRAQ